MKYSHIFSGEKPKSSRSRYFANCLMGCTALVATSFISGAAAQVPPPVTVEIDVIVEDGDPETELGGTFFLGSPGAGFFAPGLPLIDNNGNVYFFGYSDDGTGPFNNEFTAGIWSSSGGTPIAIIMDGMLLPLFTPLVSECTGNSTTCGEIFRTNPGFTVTPAGEITVLASRDDLLGTRVILAGNRFDNLAPLVTDAQSSAPFIFGNSVFFANDKGTRIIGTLIGSDPFGTPATGLTDFAAGLTGVEAPGIPGVNITSILGSSLDAGSVLVGLNNQDDLLFTAKLDNGGEALYLSPGQGEIVFSLIAQTGDAVSGIAGAEIKSIIPFFSDFSAGQAHIIDTGQGMFQGSWVLSNPQTGGNSNLPRNALWRFDAGGNPVLVVSEYNAQGFGNPITDPFYVTTAGDRTVFGAGLSASGISSAAISPNGDIYFFALGQQIDADGTTTDSGVFGLWKVPADGGMIQLVLKQHMNPPGNAPDTPGTILSDGSELWSFPGEGFTFDADGSLIIEIRTVEPGSVSAEKALYAEDSTGTLQRIIRVGDVIDVAPGVSREVQDFNFGISSPVGSASASFRNDRIALSVKFTDSSNAILRARFIGGTLEVTEFIWSGSCGDTNWHSACDDSNWNNIADSASANKSPGDAAGTENVTIVNKDVVISDRTVHLDTLNATGSLGVNQALTLEGLSSIEDLTLKADLAINAVLSLGGVNNIWGDGVISGTGMVTVGNGASLDLSPVSGSLDLKTTLKILGDAKQTGGILNLMGVDGKLAIGAGGTYEIEAGSIVDFFDGVHIINEGVFKKSTDSTVTINAFFENKSGGFVSVDGGTLKFTDPSNWAGMLEVTTGAVMEIVNTVATFGMSGQGLLAEGTGILRFSGANVIIGSGTDNSFNFTGDAGRVEMKDATNISGDGLISNLGNFELIDGTINADFDNSGLFTLVDTANLVVDDGLMTFNNADMFKKTGAGTSVVGSTAGPSTELEFVNQDTIMVEGGRLLFDNITFSFEDGGEVGVANDAKMEITGSTGSFSGETAFSGAGDLIFDSLVLFDSGTLTNAMRTGGGMVDNRLDGGLEIAMTSIFEVTSGTGIMDNFGDMSFTGGSITGVALNNHANANLSIQGAASDTRTLDATLVNNGEAFISANLFLGHNGKVDNRNDFTIAGPVSIKAADVTQSAPEFNNGGTDGRLIKVDAGDAVIGPKVRLLNDGGTIDVREGSLIIEGGALFNSRDGFSSSGGISTINLSAGGKFILRNPAESLFPVTNFFGTTTVTGAAGEDSQFVIDRTIGIDLNSTLEIFSDAAWTSLNVDVSGVFRVGSDTQAGRLTISGSPRELRNGGEFLIGEMGVVIQQSDLLIDRAVIKNKGLYRMGADLSGGLTGIGWFFIASTGSLEIEQGKEVSLTKNFFLDSGAKVIIEDNAMLDGLLIDSILISGGGLWNGNWVVGSGSSVKGVMSDISNAPISLDRLGSGVTVELNNGSELFNLPVVDGDFTIGQRAELRLKLTTFVVGGDFTNNGLISGNQSVILVDGNFTTTFSSLLSGNGIAIHANLENNGVVSPGNSPGTITINGDYTQTSTGVLEIEIGGLVAGTEYDQLIVNGVTTFEAGSAVNVTLLDLDGDGEVFIPSTGDNFNFLMSDNVILPDGATLGDLVTFTNLPQGLKFNFNLATLNGMNILQLSAIFGSSLRELTALTPFQNAVAVALDGASIGTATTNILDFALAIDGLGTESARRDAMEQAGLSFASSLFSVSRVGSDAGHDHLGRHFDSMIWAVTGDNDRMASIKAAAANDLLTMSYGQKNQQGGFNDARDVVRFVKNFADNAGGGTALASGGGLKVFVAGSYEFGSYDATLNQTGFEYSGAAVSLGMEFNNQERGWTIGMAGSVSTLNSTIDLGRGAVDSSTYGLSAYGLVQMAQNAALDVTVSYGNVKNSYRREVTVPGQAFTAAGDANGNYLTGTARFAYAIKAGNGKIGPYGQIRYSRISLDGFSETGGGDASLVIGKGIEKFVTGQIGLRVTLPVRTGMGYVIPRFSAGWNYILDQTAPMLVARFVGGPDDSFFIPTDNYSRNGLAINAGLTIQSSDVLRFSVDYQGLLFNKDHGEHSLVGRARWMF